MNGEIRKKAYKVQRNEMTMEQEMRRKDEGNEGTKGHRNAGTKDRKGRRHEGTKALRDTGTQGRREGRAEGTKGHRNAGTRGRRHE